MLWDLMQNIYERDKIKIEWRDSTIMHAYSQRERRHPRLCDCLEVMVFYGAGHTNTGMLQLYSRTPYIVYRILQLGRFALIRVDER